MKNDKNTTIQDLKKEITEFVKERNWDRFQNIRSLAISLSLESNELLDHFQWLNDKEVEDFEKDAKNKEEIAEELCDILAYILVAADKLDIDISQSFSKKIEKNSKKYPPEEFVDQTREKDNEKYQSLRKDWEKNPK